MLPCWSVTQSFHLSFTISEIYKDKVDKVYTLLLPESQCRSSFEYFGIQKYIVKKSAQISPLMNTVYSLPPIQNEICPSQTAVS